MSHSPITYIDQEDCDLLSDIDSQESVDCNVPDDEEPSCSFAQREEPGRPDYSRSDSDEDSDDELPSVPIRTNPGRPNTVDSEPVAGPSREPPRMPDPASKKRKLQEEKEARKLALEELRIYKPGQCIKHIRVEVHPTLATAWFMADVPRELEVAGLRLYTTTTLVNPGLLVWTRAMPQRLTTENGKMKMATTRKHCGMSLYICTCEEVAERAAAGSLVQHVRELRDLLGGELCVVVYGDFRSPPNGRRTANSSRRTLSGAAIDTLQIDLMVSTGADVQFINSTTDLAAWVMQCTRAVAEAPYKKQQCQIECAAANFYIRGDNRNCVTVNREGHGLGTLWQQMIGILPTASLEKARALCAKYNSAGALIESLDRPHGPSELALLGVPRDGAPEARPRRLGPEFARKLHILYTSLHGDIVVE